MPDENYIEPPVWNLKFEKPSQVRPRVFLNCPSDVELSSKDVCKVCNYKNPEYFSYHIYSYYNLEEDLNCKRCRVQPSPYRETPIDTFEARSPH
jgi:NADH dehydrogenase [ubiquinone] flavoprotein 3, mitochondrial